MQEERHWDVHIKDGTMQYWWSSIEETCRQASNQVHKLCDSHFFSCLLHLHMQTTSTIFSSQLRYMYFAILLTVMPCVDMWLKLTDVHFWQWCTVAHMTCVLCISAVRAACELQIAAVKISLNANAAILRLHTNPLQFFVYGRKIPSDAKPHSITEYIFQNRCLCWVLLLTG